jgi:hypothetical protein
MDVEMMHKRIGFRTVAVFAALVLLAGTTAHAALLTTGNTLNPAPQEAGQPSPGAVQVATTSVPFSAPGNFSGTLTSTAFRNDATNPFGLNALTFVYQVSNNQGSTNALARAVFDSFVGFQTDASWDGAGTRPARVDRLTAGDVGWSFDIVPPGGAGPILPGATSTRLVVQTDATFFGASNASVIDGAIVTGIPAIGPAIPEPASLGALALAGLMLRRRR